MHYFIGNLGHLFVIASLVTSLVAAFAYWKSFYSNDSIKKEGWRKNARTAFYSHGLSVLGVVVVLFVIIYQHYFEYHYAYSHSSRHLPGQYMVSCFWEGQEGSFLLWLFWNAVLGIVLIRTSGKSEPIVMGVFALVQVFLASTSDQFYTAANSVAKRRTRNTAADPLN